MNNVSFQRAHPLFRSNGRWDTWFRTGLALLLTILCLSLLPAPVQAAPNAGGFPTALVNQLLELPAEQFRSTLSNMSPAQRAQALQQVPPDQLWEKLKTLPAGKRRMLLNEFPSLKRAMSVAPSSGAETATPSPMAEEIREETSEEKLADAVMRESVAKSFTADLALEQFGYDLFTARAGDATPEARISIPMDYVLGPGDGFQVHLSGKEFQEHSLEVDREGMIFFPGIGHLPVSGMGFQEFKEMLRAKVKERLLGMELAHVSMGTLRTIQVLVLGEVVKPGSFTISALSTMTRALLAGGGIRPIGSLRTIQLKRQGEVVNSLDLYQLLLQGDNSADMRIRDGDVIFVPPIGATIGIGGEVKRPAIYELLHETNLETALEMAGGLLPTGNPKLVKLERIDRHEHRVLLDLDITRPKGLGTAIQAGDTIRVLPVLDRKESVVTLKGHVDREGAYQWRPGLRLIDLLPPRERLKPDTDLSYTLVSRHNARDGRLTTFTVRLDRAMTDPSSPDNLLLKPRDTVVIFSHGRTQLNKRDNNLTEIVRQIHDQARYGHQEQLITLAGHVRFPGIYPYSVGMGLREAIHAAGDLQPNADLDYALVVRTLESGDAEPISVRLKEVLGHSGNRGDTPLKPGDHILVFKSAPLPKNLFQRFDLDSLRTRTEDRFEQWSPKDAEKRVDTPDSNTVLLKSSDVIRQEFFQQNDSTDIHSETVPDRPTARPEKAPARLTLKTSDRIVETRPAETQKREELLEPVLARLREQATSSRPARITMVTGAVRFPGEYPMEHGMRVSDLLRAAGSLAEPAYTLSAVVTRFEVIRGRFREIAHNDVDLDRILKGDPAADLALNPHDVLQIKQIPRWGEIDRVTVSGNVRFPGTFPIRSGETLADLVKRAGGLSQLAFPDGAIFLRESLKDRERKEMDALAQRLEIQLAQEGGKSETQRAEDLNQVNRGLLRGLIAKLRTTEPQGRLAIDLPEILAKAASGAPYTRIILRDGDRLIVPQQSNEVTVLGEVYYPASHQHKSSLGLEDYIAMSGSYAQMADQEKVYVVKANGQVVPRKAGSPSLFGTAWFTGAASTVAINPGDTIVVPMEVAKVAPMTLWKDLSQILSNLSITAATLNTIGAL